MVVIVYDLDKNWLGYLHLTETFTKLSCLNVRLLFSVSLYLYLCNIHMD